MLQNRNKEKAIYALDIEEAETTAKHSGKQISIVGIEVAKALWREQGSIGESETFS